VLYLATSALDSDIVGWSRYEYDVSFLKHEFFFEKLVDLHNAR
jgi:hypothetical protein